MIVLDQNVISEMFRPKPDEHAVVWLGSQPMSASFTTTITQAEILYGLALLPVGRRRDALIAAIHPIFDVDLAGRILPFDSDAASVYPVVVVGRRQIGKPISQFDAQIASIVRSRGGSLATRNAADFVDCGIEIVDPWAPA